MTFNCASCVPSLHSQDSEAVPVRSMVQMGVHGWRAVSPSCGGETYCGTHAEGADVESCGHLGCAHCGTATGGTPARAYAGLLGFCF